MKSSNDPRPNLAAFDMKSGTSRVLIEDAADARFFPPDRLLFTRRGVLMTVQFDATRMTLIGQPVSILPDVMQSLNTLSNFDCIGAAQFSFSRSGDLVYCPGGTKPDVRDSLVWVDQAGKATEVTKARGPYWCPRLSPDGKRIAYFSFQKYMVWVHDISTGTGIPLTTDVNSGAPIWGPGGEYITFSRFPPGGQRNLYRIRSDGTGKMERLTKSENSQVAGSWSSDGKALAFVESSTKSGIMIFRPEDWSVKPFLDSKFSEQYPEFSPDGRWLAFTSNQSGQEQVYVSPFPGPGPIVPVTADGGWQPFWARSGRQIFFRRGLTEMWALDVIGMEPQFKVGLPRLLFTHPGYLDVGGYMSARPNRAWDISLDDKLFLATRVEDRGITPVNEMILVKNWFQELKRLVPTGK